MTTLIVDNGILFILGLAFEVLLFSGMFVMLIVEVRSFLNKKNTFPRKTIKPALAFLTISVILGCWIVYVVLTTFNKIIITDSNIWIFKSPLGFTAATITPSIEKPQITVTSGIKKSYYLKITSSRKSISAGSSDRDRLEYIKKQLTY